MNRTMDYKRHQDFVKAIRKRNIDKEIHLMPGESIEDFHPWYSNLHQYSKNKIFCSCAMCSCKTNNKTKRDIQGRNCSPSRNWSISDRKKLDSMKNNMEEVI